jgi:hypothetical protein
MTWRIQNSKFDTLIEARCLVSFHIVYGSSFLSTALNFGIDWIAGFRVFWFVDSFHTTSLFFDGSVRPIFSSRCNAADQYLSAVVVRCWICFQASKTKSLRHLGVAGSFSFQLLFLARFNHFVCFFSARVLTHSKHSCLFPSWVMLILIVMLWTAPRHGSRRSTRPASKPKRSTRLSVSWQI